MLAHPKIQIQIWRHCPGSRLLRKMAPAEAPSPFLERHLADMSPTNRENNCLKHNMNEEMKRKHLNTYRWRNISPTSEPGHRLSVKPIANQTEDN